MEHLTVSGGVLGVPPAHALTLSAGIDLVLQVGNYKTQTVEVTVLRANSSLCQSLNINSFAKASILTKIGNLWQETVKALPSTAL